MFAAFPQHTPTTYQNQTSYATNGRAKLILVVDDAAPREDALAAVLKGMHHAYCDALACPFYDVGAPLESRAFSAAVDAAVASYG
jgi:hypothetical protein